MSTAAHRNCRWAAVFKSYGQPTVFFLNKCADSGAKIAINTADHANEAITGCCIGHACNCADGFGLPNKGRTAAVTALTGFQFAIVCNHPGIPEVGTMALDTMASGKRMISPMPWADSGPLETMPSEAQAQDKAYINSSAMPKPARIEPALASVRQPIARPVKATID